MPETLKRNLVESALGFIETSIGELKGATKYSVIHFAFGVELILKARLLHEHWSLVAERPGTVTLAQLRSGEFKSVRFTDAMKRIAMVTGKPIPKRAVGRFEQVNSHRNRIVHFYNPALKSGGEKERRKVAIEQCSAWLELADLVRRDWADLFEPYSVQIAAIEAELTGHRVYFQARYDDVRPQLEAMIGARKTVDQCDRCKFRSVVVVQQSSHSIVRRACKVCESWHLALELSCRECSSRIYLEPEIVDPECPECGESFDTDFIADCMEVEDDPCAYCSDVCSLRTVHAATDGSGFVCIQCLETYADVAECEYCYEACAGFDPEGSYLMGCAACDGRGDGD